MDDLISRQIAQKLFGEALTYQEQKGKLTWTTSEVKQWIADFIEDLPSAQPKWMKAKWKPVEVDSDDNVWLWECENCHEETEFKWDFCPVCGCEMTNEQRLMGDGMSNLIRRQDAIDLIEQFYAFESKSEQIALQIAMRDLPSAQPEPKSGRWIKTARWGRVYYCNQCRNYLDFDGVNAGRGSTNFCPNCGADMRGEQDDT